jgi:hypothetical protein
VVAWSWDGCEACPCVGLRTAPSTDRIDPFLESHDRNGAPRAALKRPDRVPAVVSHDIGVAIRHRDPVLLDEATKGEDNACGGGNADMIGATRDRCGDAPRIRARVEYVVEGPCDIALGIAADHVHTVTFHGGPRHLAAWNR